MVGRGESTGDRQRDKCSEATTNHSIIPRRLQTWWPSFVVTPADLIWLTGSVLVASQVQGGAGAAQD